MMCQILFGFLKQEQILKKVLKSGPEVIKLFMPPKELREAYSNRTVRPSVSPSVPLRVRCISPIFFEIGIPNLVCGYILGWWSVAYHFQVTVTLTSDLVFRIIVSGAYLILFEVGISNLVCGCILG